MDKPDGVEIEVAVERSRSPVPLVIAMVVVAVLAAALGLSRGDDTNRDDTNRDDTNGDGTNGDAAVPTSSTPSTTTPRSPTSTTAPPTLTGTPTPLISGEPPVADAGQPIWLAAGPSRDDRSMTLIRLEADSLRRSTFETRLDVGDQLSIFRVDGSIIWTDGERLRRADQTLQGADVDLGPGEDVHPRDEETMWVEADGRLLAVAIADGEVVGDFGPVVAPLRAPLTEGAFIVSVGGAAGVWFPGGRAGRVATSYVASNQQITVLAEQDRLVLADTAPFVVRSTVELDANLIIRGLGALSPDGRRVALQVVEGSSIELGIVDLSTGAVERPGVSVGSAAPLWLDDEQLITIGLGDGREAPVWLLDLSGDSDRPPPAVLAMVADDRTWAIIPG